jgi:hypothetical protein
MILFLFYESTPCLFIFKSSSLLRSAVALRPAKSRKFDRATRDIISSFYYYCRFPFICLCGRSSSTTDRKFQRVGALLTFNGNCSLLVYLMGDILIDTIMKYYYVFIIANVCLIFHVGSLCTKDGKFCTCRVVFYVSISMVLDIHVELICTLKWNREKSR